MKQLIVAGAIAIAAGIIILVVTVEVILPMNGY